MGTTNTRPYHASRKSSKGEDLWAIRAKNSQEVIWLLVSEIDPGSHTTLAVFEAAELQALANQYGEVQAYPQTEPNQEKKQQPQSQQQPPVHQQQPVATQTSAASQNA